MVQSGNNIKETMECLLWLGYLQRVRSRIEDFHVVLGQNGGVFVTEAEEIRFLTVCCAL